MLRRIKELARPWIDLKKFNQLNREEKGVVFYGESRGMARHLHPLVKIASQTHGLNVSYVASDVSDAMILSPIQGVKTTYVGSRNAAAAFFKTLDAALVLTTTPDLGYAAYMRSSFDVHYAYVHHSIISSHMAYKAKAFDQFDTIFCAGPHHVSENKLRESIVATPEKNLVEYGYPRIDDLMRHSENARAGGALPEAVLIAPTWGSGGLLETMGHDLIRSVVSTGRKVILRPHPETIIRQPKLVLSLADAFADEANFVLAPDVSMDESFHESAVMISDWSGAAFEFSLGLERPVVYIDVPKKILNPDFNILGINPVEVSFRSRLGKVLAPADLTELPTLLEQLISSGTEVDIPFAREELIFNVGQSALAGGREVKALWDRYR